MSSHQLASGRRELEAAREHFLTSQEPHPAAVRESILDSWRRSQSLRVSPDRVELPFIREPNLDSPLMSAAAPVLKQLAADLAAEPISVILTSADGVVLHRGASDRRLNRSLDNVQLTTGYSYAEEFVGTNGIGTALETRTPTLVTGGEHYADALGRLTCAGIPIIHPLTGVLVGALDLTGWVDQGGTLLATLAKSATSQIQTRLLAQSSARETALLNAYLRACRHSSHGVIAVGGDIALTNRHVRESLDAYDQAALLEHAVDLLDEPNTGHTVVTLPSGCSVRLDTGDELTLLQSHRAPARAAPSHRGSGRPRTAPTSAAGVRRRPDLGAQRVSSADQVQLAG